MSKPRPDLPEIPGPPGLHEVCLLVEGLKLGYLVDDEKERLLIGLQGEKAHYDVAVAVSQEEALVYLGVREYLAVPRDHPRAAAVMRRLMELNATMVVGGHFEWNPEEREVRVAQMLSTECGVSEDGLKAALRALIDLADACHHELHRLVAT